MATTTLPAGITGFDPMPYGYRRWDGAVWPDIQVDAYNRELERIQSRHEAGYNVQALVNGLYNLASGFDYAMAERDSLTPVRDDTPVWRDFKGTEYTEAEAQRLWPWGHTLDRIRAGVGRVGGGTL